VAPQWKRRGWPHPRERGWLNGKPNKNYYSCTSSNSNECILILRETGISWIELDCEGVV
jgi:hypothetical protein